MKDKMKNSKEEVKGRRGGQGDFMWREKAEKEKARAKERKSQLKTPN